MTTDLAKYDMALFMQILQSTTTNKNASAEQIEKAFWRIAPEGSNDPDWRDYVLDIVVPELMEALKNEGWTVQYIIE